MRNKENRKQGQFRRMAAAFALTMAAALACTGMSAMADEDDELYDPDWEATVDPEGFSGGDWEENAAPEQDDWQPEADPVADAPADASVDAAAPDGDAAEDWSWDEVGDELLDFSGMESGSAEGMTAAEAARTLAMEQAREKAQLLSMDVIDLPQADTEYINTYLEELKSVDSPTGSDGELILADYIMQTLGAYGYQVSTQEFHEGFMNEDMIDVPGMNVIVERVGDSELADGHYLLVCAHYDSKTDPDPEDPFASDKTGAAVLMETARLLANIPTADNLCFLFLSGEEDGHYGSQSFVEYLPDDIKAKVDGVICLGELGYTADQPYILGTYDAEPGTIGENLMAASVLEVDMDICNVALQDKETARVFFASDNMPAVDLFQDVNNFYADRTGYSGAVIESEEAPEGEHILFGDPDPAALAKIANVLARTVSFYMDPRQIYGDRIVFDNGQVYGEVEGE